MNEPQKILSIDIETLSTEPDGVILSIGACVVGTDKTFHRYCFVDSQLIDGRQISSDIHNWWLTQPKLDFSRELVHGGDPRTFLTAALVNLAAFIRDEAYENDLIYSKGSMDIYMLEHAFKQYNFVIPWEYRNVRDLRTLMEDAKIDVKALPFSNDNAHNALSDAVYQGKIIKLAREKLNL